VRSGCERSTHYFSSSGVPRAVSIKSAPEHVMLNLCFCIRWDLWVVHCIPVHPGHKTSKHYLSCLGGPGAVSLKGVLGHVTPKLYFCIQWDLWVTYCSSVHPGHEISMHYFLRLGGTIRLHKKCAGTLYTKLMFLHPVGSCRSPSALWCIPGMKHRHTIFHARVGPVRI
jgi:hypothetical protein